MAFTLRRNNATFLSLEPINTNTNLAPAPAPAQATSSAAPTVPATRAPAPLRRSRATFIPLPLEPVPTNTPAPPPPAQASSSTAPNVGPQPLRRSRATFIPLPLEPAPTNTAVPPPPPQASSSTAPRVAPQPLSRSHATIIPLEPTPANTSLPPPPARASASTAPRVAPQPLSRSHATMISLAPLESTSATNNLPPPPTQATSSTPPITPAAVPTPTPSASTFAPIAELPFPLPEADMLYACNYACGPQLCDWCSKDRPPIGAANPIPHFIISTIIRHKLPHKFESLEQIKDREIATGLVDPPNVGERDDAEYQPGGDFQPPAWGSERARPKKSSMKRTSTRFAPYPDPSTRNALVRRSTEDIKASLDEAHANRIQSNYEGPVAIAIRNEISDLNIPGEAPFKWEPEYTGPPSDTLPEGDTLTSDTTDDAMEEDLEDEAAVVQMVLTTQSKKRRYAEDDNDATTNSTPNASPTKKLRTTRRLPGSKLAAFSLPSFKLPSFTLTISFPSLSATLSFPSPTRSASPSATSTAVATDSSASDGESSLSPRKQRLGKKKLRFLLSDPSSLHPKFGIPDSIYFHHRRLNSTSKNGRSQKKSKLYVPQDKETWTPEEVEFAVLGKEDWEEMRKTSLERKTSLKNLEERVKRSEAMDAAAERFQKLVDKYEEDCEAVDLKGVRARFIRPRRNEVPREKNKEAMPRLGPLDQMRRHYPAFDHPAWDGVDAAAIAEWTSSDHYQLLVNDVMHSVAREEKGKGKEKANAEPDEATEIATVEDEDEERMRREYLAAEVDEVEAPRRSGSGSAWGAAPGGEGDGGLSRQSAMSAVDFDSQWSAPSAPPPTGFDDAWSTPGAGPSTWAAGF